MPVAVVIPVRSFRAGMVRLSGILDEESRIALARTLADRVVGAARDLACFVVTGDAEVGAWALQRGALVVEDPGLGLDRAVMAGRQAAADDGASAVIVAHADLALATDLTWVADFDGVTIVTDRHNDGTNVLVVPARGPFAFSYGVGSRERHIAAAKAAGLAWRVVHDDALGWDIDSPADLIALPDYLRPDAKQRRPEAAAACERSND